jgi:hypothetical protein
LQSSDGSHEDANLLLAIKDAEISTLRQQMAQLADDLKRNLAVSPGACLAMGSSWHMHCRACMPPTAAPRQNTCYTLVQ